MNELDILIPTNCPELTNDAMIPFLLKKVGVINWRTTENDIKTVFQAMKEIIETI